MSQLRLSSDYAEPGSRPLPAGPPAAVHCNFCDTAAATNKLSILAKVSDRPISFWRYLS